MFDFLGFLFIFEILVFSWILYTILENNIVNTVRVFFTIIFVMFVVLTVTQILWSSSAEYRNEDGFPTIYLFGDYRSVLDTSWGFVYVVAGLLALPVKMLFQLVGIPVVWR
jgi:hypothetical protein